MHFLDEQFSRFISSMIKHSHGLWLVPPLDVALSVNFCYIVCHISFLLTWYQIGIKLLACELESTSIVASVPIPCPDYKHYKMWKSSSGWMFIPYANLQYSYTVAASHASKWTLTSNMTDAALLQSMKQHECPCRLVQPKSSSRVECWNMRCKFRARVYACIENVCAGTGYIEDICSDERIFKGRLQWVQRLI